MRAPRRVAYTSEEQAKTSQTGWHDGFYTMSAATVMAATRKPLGRTSSMMMMRSRGVHRRHHHLVSFEGYSRQDAELLTFDRSGCRQWEGQRAHSDLRPSQKFLSVTSGSVLLLDE